MKYIKISIVILLVSFISIFAYKLTTNNSSNKLSLTKEQMKEMISYTIDGNSTSSMPTKGSGYKVKSITCKSGSILSWDNDNWLLEVEKLESEELCNIDFTTGTGSYTVTAVPSIAGSLDSTSKTTTDNGTVTFYTDAIIDSVSGCTNEISDGKVIIKNVTSNTTCIINVSFIKLYDRLLENNPTVSERTDFSTSFTTNTANTLYKAKEDNIDVYYFAGIDGTPAHCEYDGRIIENVGAEIDKATCTSSFEVCEVEDSLGYGLEGICEDDYYGTSITVNKGIWVDTVSKPINNWVKFGKNASKQDLYWRIIRTNSDGGVRLLYHGTSTTAENAYIGISVFNGSKNNIAYVSYMYGSLGSVENARENTNNSTIKTAIDKWYKDNLNTNYGKYISTTAVYCNDRSTSDNTYFGAYTRLYTNKTPSYDCSATEDKFTVDSSTGNGKLTYPIALMTADEIAYAGGVSGEAGTIWYYSNSLLESSTGSTWWWLLSPNFWNGSNASVFYVGDSASPGYLLYNYVDGPSGGVRPVISLKSDVLYKSGDGSAESPYEIQETPDTISDVVKANAVNENGYRYEGSDPNNYIQMQKSDGTTEMWRIIGLFPDGESGENVIRVRKVGYESAAYDSNNTNHWPNTTLYTTLSSTYTLANYKNTVNYKMYLGGANNVVSYTLADLYDMERMLNSKGTAGKTAQTSYQSATIFIGSVGLIYPSDYGYAVLASDCARTIMPYNYPKTVACKNNNWLYQGVNNIQWLISPYPSDGSVAFYVHSSGNISNSDYYGGVFTSYPFSPVMALKSDVKVTGSGTKTDPYVME